MELLDATQAMDKYGSPNTLTLNEIGSVLEIPRIGKNDIFMILVLDTVGLYAWLQRKHLPDNQMESSQI
jgi:hypothetical protein